jgi:hypothetical protein
MRYIRQSQLIRIAALSVVSMVILATMLVAQRYFVCVASGLSEQRNLRAAEMLDPESGVAEAVAASKISSDVATDRFQDTKSHTVATAGTRRSGACPSASKLSLRLP